MRTFIRGEVVENAKSYTLFEIVNGEYESRGTATEINFEISELENLGEGEHEFVVQAHGDGLNYEDSEYSEPVSYTVSANSGTETPDDGGGTTDVSYTITYKYMSGSTEIKTATTEQVAVGTVKTFSTDEAPAIDGYTVSSVSPTSATISSDTTVTYTYTANGEQETVNVTVNVGNGATISDDSELKAEQDVIKGEEYLLKVLIVSDEYSLSLVIIKDTNDGLIEEKDIPAEDISEEGFFEYKYTPEVDCSIKITTSK